MSAMPVLSSKLSDIGAEVDPVVIEILETVIENSPELEVLWPSKIFVR
jgi:hypothetical protein